LRQQHDAKHLAQDPGQLLLGRVGDLVLDGVERAFDFVNIFFDFADGGVENVFDAVEAGVETVFDFAQSGVENVFYAVGDVVDRGEVDARLERAARNKLVGGDTGV
jgi:hypothetical protein